MFVVEPSLKAGHTSEGPVRRELTADEMPGAGGTTRSGCRKTGARTGGQMSAVTQSCETPWYFCITGVRGGMRG